MLHHGRVFLLGSRLIFRRGLVSKLNDRPKMQIPCTIDTNFASSSSAMVPPHICIQHLPSLRTRTLGLCNRLYPSIDWWHKCTSLVDLGDSAAHTTMPPARSTCSFLPVTLYGPALFCVQLLLRRDPSISWNSYWRSYWLVLVRTRKSMIQGTTHDSTRGSLSLYFGTFKARIAQTNDVPNHQHVGFFLAGLKPAIRLQHEDLSITSYLMPFECSSGLIACFNHVPVPIVCLPVTSQSHCITMSSSDSHILVCVFLVFNLCISSICIC